MGSDGELSRWANARAQAEHVRLYGELRSEAWAALHEAGWEAHPTEQAVDTPFGPTLAYRWAGEGTSVVLLHGAGTCSLMWAPLIAHLTGRAVVAVDGVGEPGRSVQTSALRDADDLSAWLGTTLAGLDVDRAHLVGASYGGYLAVGHALRAPERVASLTLAEPVLDPLARGFWTYGLKVGAALALPGSWRDRRLRALRMGILAEGRDRRRFALLGQTRFRRRGLPAPVPVPDSDLARLVPPLLVGLGAESPIHDAAALAERVRAARPDATVVVFDEAGHTLPVDAADRLAPVLRAFLDDAEVRSGP
jgi:pimeloyl-ACP methyl ester carboxylesterase